MHWAAEFKSLGYEKTKQGVELTITTGSDFPLPSGINLLHMLPERRKYSQSSGNLAMTIVNVWRLR